MAVFFLYIPSEFLGVRQHLSLSLSLPTNRRKCVSESLEAPFVYYRLPSTCLYTKHLVKTVMFCT